MLSHLISSCFFFFFFYWVFFFFNVRGWVGWHWVWWWVDIWYWYLFIFNYFNLLLGLLFGNNYWFGRSGDLISLVFMNHELREKEKRKVRRFWKGSLSSFYSFRSEEFLFVVWLFKIFDFRVLSYFPAASKISICLGWKLALTARILWPTYWMVLIMMPVEFCCFLLMCLSSLLGHVGLIYNTRKWSPFSIRI